MTITKPGPLTMAHVKTVKILWKKVNKQQSQDFHGFSLNSYPCSSPQFWNSLAQRTFASGMGPMSPMGPKAGAVFLAQQLAQRRCAGAPDIF